MKLTIYVNGEETDIVLTSAQIAQVKKAGQKITDRIQDYKDACEDQGIAPLKLSDFDFLPKKDRAYHYYDHRQVIIKRALNQGWEPDYNDPNQEKHYIVFKWVGSGVGFSLYYSFFVNSSSLVGARHEFKTKELALHYAKQFINEVNECFIIKK